MGEYSENQIKSKGLFQLRAQEGQTIKEKILHAMINNDYTQTTKNIFKKGARVNIMDRADFIA